jgi:PhnB protein
VKEPFATSIAPWLEVANADAALAFYDAAFGVSVLYRFDGDGTRLEVAQLSVCGAVFWIQRADDSGARAAPGASVRMILSVEDPDAAFEQAVRAGATVVGAVSEQHGWRAGRITDPFGYDWELARQLGS